MAVFGATTKTKFKVFRSSVKTACASMVLTMDRRFKQKLQVFINKSLRKILLIWWHRQICAMRCSGSSQSSDQWGS